MTSNKLIVAWKIALKYDEHSKKFILAKPLAESYATIRSEIEAIRDRSGWKYNLFRTGILDYSVIFYLLDSIQKQGYQAESISPIEMQWIKGATHGEKIRFFTNWEDGKYQYDVRSAYASVCVKTPYKQSIFLPLKRGKYETISNEDFQSLYQKRELRYGIYRCLLEPTQLSSTHPASFIVYTNRLVEAQLTPYEYYTSDDLIVASTLGFQATLATDGQPNFLYYTCIQKEHVCEKAERLFGDVLRDWSELRRSLPTNSLLKLMLSAFAGYLSSKKWTSTRWCSLEEMNPDEKLTKNKRVKMTEEGPTY